VIAGCYLGSRWALLLERVTDMARTLPRALPLLLSCAAIAACALTLASTSAATGSGSASGSASASSSSSSPAARTVLYGIGDSAGHFAECVDATSSCCYGDPASCPAGTVTGYWNDPWFKALTSSASAHRVRYVRLFVSIDAVAAFNGSTTSPGCDASRVLQQPWTDAAGRPHPAGESLQDLLAGLVQAHADGLTPVVSIAGYPIASARSSFQSPAPDPTTPAGYWSYRCGVEGILGAVSRLPADEQPHVWEAFNEPDTIPIYQMPGGESTGAASSTGSSAPASDAASSVQPSSGAAPGCAVTPTGIADGPAKAACGYVLADRLIHGFAGHAGDTLLAGVFSHLSPTYLQQYVAQLAHALPAAEFPASWAVHDYSGVTRGYQGSSLDALAAWDKDLGADSGGRAKDVWITETGMLLSSRRRVDGCPANGTDPAHTLGACLSGDSADQLSDLASFFEMPSAGTSVPITHLFWYQWQGAPTWDSGLTDAAGVPRTAWCAFFGSGNCTGSQGAA
jgi:hypothetical protein